LRGAVTILKKPYLQSTLFKQLQNMLWIWSPEERHMAKENTWIEAVIEVLGEKITR
jgi:hypothetical protein